MIMLFNIEFSVILILNVVMFNLEVILMVLGVNFLVSLII